MRPGRPSGQKNHRCRDYPAVLGARAAANGKKCPERAKNCRPYAERPDREAPRSLALSPLFPAGRPEADGTRQRIAGRHRGRARPCPAGARRGRRPPAPRIDRTLQAGLRHRRDVGAHTARAMAVGGETRRAPGPSRGVGLDGAGPGGRNAGPRGGAHGAAPVVAGLRGAPRRALVARRPDRQAGRGAAAPPATRTSGIRQGASQGVERIKGHAPRSSTVREGEDAEAGGGRAGLWDGGFPRHCVNPQAPIGQRARGALGRAFCHAAPRNCGRPGRRAWTGACLRQKPRRGAPPCQAPPPEP